MKKTTFFKSLLVAAGLLVGTSGAWADGNKRILNSQNYETATASDWKSTNGTVSLGTGDETYGNYSKVNVSGNGNRTCSKTIGTYAYDPGTGFADAAMTTAGFVIEFDMMMSGGSVNNRSISQFFVGTSDFKETTNNSAYTGSDFVFSLTQPLRDADGRVTDWYINDINNEGTAVTIQYTAWYHYKLVVSGSSVEYTITHKSTTDATITYTDATGSFAVSALPSIKGFYGLLGRGSGFIYFDNLEIYDYTETVTVSAPTFKFNKVDGANRLYTITNPDGIGTLYYTTSPVDEAPAVGDAAYSSTTDLFKEVSYSKSGKYYAYVLHTNGTTASAVTTQEVTAGELTLAAPEFTVVDMVLAEDGYYYPKVSFASNNASLEGAPTATFNVSSPYTFTGVGTLTVTASAEGYTSSTETFEVKNSYLLSKTIDFGALTASNFDNTVWVTATGAPRDLWTNRSAAIPADVTYYKLIKTSSDYGDPDNSAVLEGITISNYHQRVPEVYIGYGLLTPYTAVSGSNNYMNFTVNGGTSVDYIVYNGWNNYGNGTFNTVLAGNATFGLYRYDTMLRTIKVYSPNSVSTTIGTTGYSTYACAYAADLDGISGATAYYASDVADGKVTLSEATGTVAAGTGLILKGTAGTEVTIPVALTGTKIDGNLLVGCLVDTKVAQDANSYVLVNNGGTAEFESLANMGATIPAGKAYLKAPAADGARLSIVFDTTTGISTVATQSVENDAVYNLQGQRVVNAQKGLFIINGKKVVLK